MPEVSLPAVNGANQQVNLAAWQRASGNLESMVRDESTQFILGSRVDAPAIDNVNSASIVSLLKRTNTLLTQQITNTFVLSATSNVTVGSTLTNIIEYDVSQDVITTLELDNIGNNSLFNFQILVRNHPTGAWWNLGNLTSNYTTDTGIATNNSMKFIISATSDPNTLSAGSRCLIVLNTSFVSVIQVNARTQSGNTTIKVRQYGSSRR